MEFNPLTLKFKGNDAPLEVSFLDDYLTNSLTYIRLALTLGCIFFAVFGILDAILISEKKLIIWTIRYGIVCPTILFVIFLTYIPKVQNWLQPILCFLIVISGGGIVSMIIIAPPPISYSYYAGLSLIFMFGYCILRTRFIWASLAGWVVVILYELAAVFHQTPVPVLINNNFFFVGANITGMIACYSIEFFSRRAYFLNWLLLQEKEKVNSANLELEKRVKERTDELKKTNDKLVREISERKQSEEINKTLFAISNALNMTSNIDDLYRQIHHLLSHSIDVTNFFIAMVNEKEHTLYFPYHVDTVDDDFSPLTHFDPKDSLTGFVVSNRKPVLLKNKELQTLADKNGVWGPVPLIWMGVPLIVHDEIIGVVVVQSYTDPDLYTEQDLEILVSISAQIAVAIDRKRTEDELSRSEEKFRATFKTSPHVITLTKVEDGLYVDINNAFTKLLGYSAEEVIGKSSLALDIWTNPEDRERLVAGLKKNGIVENLRADFKGKEGQIINGLMSARIIDIEDTKYLLAVTQDMTKLKKIEQERLDLEIRLQQAQKMEAIGTLAGGIAHDFNNILSGIFGYTHLAMKELEDPQKVKERIGQIDKGAKRAAELVRQILTFSRQDVYQKHPLQIAFAIKEALQLLRSTIPRSIEIRKKILSDSAVLADPIKIHQLLINLCTNAYHAIGEKNGCITITLTDKTLQKPEKKKSIEIPPGNYLILEVSDTGQGIDKSIIEKIFDPYFTTKQLGQGTGLGLALVKAIVNEHDGYITVRSQSGKGTSFMVYFPVFQDNAEKTMPTAIEQTSEGGNERVMLVDDEQAIREVTEEILKNNGYKVSVFEDGFQALSEFEKDPNKYDLIITDMTMPKMTGDNLAVKILEKNPFVPILICTGFSESLTDEKAAAIGVKKILNKPLTMNTLLRNIREILNVPPMNSEKN